jgi:hypothetical protein
MRTHPLNRGIPSGKTGSLTGSLAARAALLLFAGFAMALPSLKAQDPAVVTSCQTDIENYLSAHSEGTAPDYMITCSTSQLASAVAAVIAADSTATVGNTPPCFVISALVPYPYGANGASSRSASSLASAAVAVTDAAINQVIATGTTSAITTAVFENHIANITDLALNVTSLTQADREAVLGSALTTVAAAYASALPSHQPMLKASVQQIGQAISDDVHLEALGSAGLNPVLEAGMAEVASTAPAYAPYLARAFADGLTLSSSNTFTWPAAGQGVTAQQFLVNILSPVAANTTIDTLVAHDVAAGLYNNNVNSTANGNNPLGSVVSAGQSLFANASYSTAAVKTALTVGLTAGITQGNDQETQRISFAQQLASSEVSSAAAIEQGAIYVDPYYAGGFTYGIFNSIYTSSHATLASDAPTLATDAGNIIGADGNVLTNVANTFGEFIGAGKLSAANAGTYALNLINGAQNGTVPVNTIIGGGGSFNDHNTTGVVDMASIVDVLALGVKNSFGTINTTNASTFGSDIGLIAKNIAYIVTAYSFTDTQNANRSGPIAEFIAGTLSDYLVSLGLNSTALNDALTDIKTDVNGVIQSAGTFTQTTKTQVENEVSNAVNESLTSTNPYGGNQNGDYGAIAVQETTVTNL